MDLQYFKPVACGYEPCIGSYNEVCSPTDAEGINPMEPEITEASSLKYRQINSPLLKHHKLGHCTNRIATASTNHNLP
jgi:hypothetical protein